MERTLLVGLDLSDDYSQLSCFNRTTYEPVCINVEADNTEDLIPSALAIHKETREWMWGMEALRTAEEGEAELIDHFISRIALKEPILVMGREISPVTLLVRFFRKTFSLLKKYEPNDTIQKLVVTLANPEPDLTNVIYEALYELGIEKDRAIIQSHRKSYLYYALSQKKELWMNDVGLFDFSEQGLHYYQIAFDRRRSPMIVGVSEKDYSDVVSLSMFTDEGREQAEYIFENVVKSALHKQIISTLYMIGSGFDGRAVTDSCLQHLCVGRRMFKGKNLYVKGACYSARELAGEGKLDDLIFLDDDMLNCHVSAKVYIDASESEVILAKAGTPWYEVDQTLDIIPDEEVELQVLVRNVVSREVHKLLIPLEPIRGRENRMTRLSIRVTMQDTKTCLLTIKDKGFGYVVPTTHRVWERKIDLA